MLKKKKLRFAVISCGGTILMAPNGNGVLVPIKTIHDLLSEVNLSALKDKINIGLEKRMEIFKEDSANFNQEHWKQIIEVIEKTQDEFDGILIFHGTDTMAYSATAAGLVLSTNLKVPVIFTGSQVSNGNTGSDAKANVERAFLVLYQAAVDGVRECMIYFGEEAYRGVTSRKRSESDFRGFESPSVRSLYVVGGLGVKSKWQTRKAADIKKSKKRIGITIKNDFAGGIVVLSAIPGLEADILMAIAELDTTKAIILHSLGAGNIPALEGKYNLIPVIEKITRKLGKPVIVTSPFVGGTTNMDLYLPGKLAKAAGAINADKMTVEATVVKTRLLLAQPEFSKSQKAFSKAFATDFAGETCTI